MTMVEPSTLTSSSSGLKKIGHQAHFFLVRNLTCSSLHQGRFGICHRRRTPGNILTYKSLHQYFISCPERIVLQPLDVGAHQSPSSPPIVGRQLRCSRCPAVPPGGSAGQQQVGHKISSCGSGAGQQQDLRVDQRQDTSRMITLPVMTAVSMMTDLRLTVFFLKAEIAAGWSRGAVTVRKPS